MKSLIGWLEDDIENHLKKKRMLKEELQMKDKSNEKNHGEIRVLI